MNNKIKLAVAGAVLSAASVANAGIVIPAGDWTLTLTVTLTLLLHGLAWKAKLQLLLQVV